MASVARSVSCSRKLQLPSASCRSSHALGMLDDGRTIPPRSYELHRSLTTSSTLPASERPSGLDRGLTLARIHSFRLPTAEGMLAGTGGELGRGVRMEEEKLASVKGDEVEWTYPEGGRGWLVVLGCFILASTILGYALTWGVLVQDLATHQHPTVPLSVLNLVVGLANFMQNFTAYGAGRLGDKYGYKRIIAVGACLTFISLILSALTSHSLPCLFIFNGFCLGVSSGLGMPLFLSLPAQWFEKRRGLASGLTTAGTGIGGGISSLIMRALLPRVRYRNTMLIYAGMSGVAWIIAWHLLAVRLPPLPPGQTSRAPKTWLPRGIWSNPTWYSFILCIFIGIFGYLTPYYFLTAYTTLKVPSLDPTSILHAIPLTVANFACGFGRIFAGLVSDQIGPINSMFLSFFIGGVLQLVLWPFAQTFPSILAFAILEGLFGSWCMSLIPVSAAQLFGIEGLATIVGFAVLCNSPGQFLGATLSGLVLSCSSSYTAVAAYSGSMMVGGAGVLLYARFANERRVFAKF